MPKHVRALVALVSMAVLTPSALHAQFNISDLLSYSATISSPYGSSPAAFDAFSMSLIGKGFLLTDFKNTVNRANDGSAISATSHHVFTRMVIPDTGESMTVDTSGIPRQIAHQISITSRRRIFRLIRAGSKRSRRKAVAS